MAIGRSMITGLVLAGGRGSRMGGVDKGLQDFRGIPLALNALQRITPQVSSVMFSANRNLATYAALGAPAWPDETAATGAEDYAGPLAGFLSGLSHCPTPFLLVVPCDVPLFPQDLAERLARAMRQDETDVVVASAAEAQDEGEAGAPLRPQPVFCLLRANLRESLADFLRAGGRKPGAWTSQLKTRLVPFDRPGDGLAFSNANTLAELRQLETGAMPPDGRVAD
ncbi:MAG: molybdenum cofactor guanylyltransferase MobA [Comamonadaceae bacterium]|nr:MAG: molybdenum cofactor guanylyltransferase MobA [Comamonadaceae bacterium]